MAASTKAFTLTTAAYQDISEGAENCAFRLRVKSQRDNSIRIILSTSLPSANDEDYDVFIAPNDVPDTTDVSFTGLASSDRVYARADSATTSITVYRI